MVHPGSTPHLANASIDLVVSLAQSGDSQAFSELLGRNKKLVWRTAFSILKHSDDADDVTQETFLRVLTKIHTFAGQAAFSTWLTRIAINLSFMRLRSRRTRPVCSMEEFTDKDALHSLLIDLSPDPEQSYLLGETKAMLRDAINGLPTVLRGVTEDQIYKEVSIQEVANCRGLTLAATKSRAYRARKLLMRDLTGEPADRGIASA